MPTYVFTCKGREHTGERDFERTFHSLPKNVIDKVDCSVPGCGAVAKRRFDLEIPTQSIIGIKPLSHASTTPGNVAHTAELAFGKFRQNPDGTVDKNHRPFDSTGDMDKFINGANDLGKPKINQRTGEPLRRQDGSIVREGAKLVKLGPGAAPSRDGVRKQSSKRGGVYRNGPVTAEWAGAGAEKAFGNT